MEPEKSRSAWWKYSYFFWKACPWIYYQPCYHVVVHSRSISEKIGHHCLDVRSKDTAHCCPPESVCFLPATHVDLSHTKVKKMKLKRLWGKLSASYLDVRRKDLSTSNHISTRTHTCSHNELAHQLFSTSQFIVCDLRFLLPTAAGLFSNGKQELCWFPFPPYQNPLNKESCCLLAFCLRINRGRQY